MNYDPVDETVLANEQVIEGRGERSGALVELRIMKQYFLQTKGVAGRLHEDLQKCGGLDWPSHVKKVQRNWIGRVDGGFITGGLVVDHDHDDVIVGHQGGQENVRVFVEESLKTIHSEMGLVAVVGATNKSILDRYVLLL